MKTRKICRKVKISISPRGGTFQFSARGERYVYLKKISPRGEFHLAYTYVPLTFNIFRLETFKVVTDEQFWCFVP